MRTWFTLYILALVSLASCSSHWDLRAAEGDSCILQSETADRDDMASIIAPFKDSLDQVMSAVLCENLNDMSKARPESALGNWFADALLFEGRKIHNDSIDFAMFNTGGIRSSMSAGQVTVGDIFQLMPFDNELVVVELSFEKVRDLLAYLSNTGGEPVADLQILLTDSGYKDVIVSGYPLENRTYQILTSDYLATGGDRMDFFEEDNRNSLTPLRIKVRDAFLSHCSELGRASTQINSKTDGRIRYER